MKYVHPASPKARKAYYKLNKQQKEDYLNDQKNIQKNGRATNTKLRIAQFRSERFTGYTNSLPSMSSSNLDGSVRERSNTASSVLQSNEHNHMEQRKTNRPKNLRWSDYGRATGSITRQVGFQSGFKVGLAPPLIKVNNKPVQPPVVKIPKRFKGKKRQPDLHHGLPDRKISAVYREKPDIDKPVSLAERYLQDLNQSKAYDREIKYFRVVRKTLDPEILLDELAQSHGLIKANYTTLKARDGSARIRVGSRALNVSDFCTKHMNLSWNDTKEVLTKAYKIQTAAKEERQAINSIAFVSSRAIRPHNAKWRRSKIHESLLNFSYLKMKEQSEAKKMSIDDLEKHRTTPDPDEANSISKAEVDLKSITDSFLRQQEMAKHLNYKLSDLVATKDKDEKYIDFKDKHTGEKLFRDYGHRIVMNSRKPDYNNVASAMTLAAQNFGTVKITGSKEFKQQVIDVAVAKDLNVVFANKEMQAEFIRCKEEAKHNAAVEQAAKRHDPITETVTNALADAEKIKADHAIMKDATSSDIADKAKSHMETLKGYSGTVGYKYVQEAIVSGAENNSTYNDAITNAVKTMPKMEAGKSTAYVKDESSVTLVKHGTAPYLHDKSNKDSYFVELSNGEVKWGVGLKDAINNSGAKIGDTVEVDRVGERDVLVNVAIKDDKGNVIGREAKEVQRAEWSVTVKGREQEQAQEQPKQPAKQDNGKVNLSDAEMVKNELTAMQQAENKDYAALASKHMDVLLGHAGTKQYSDVQAAVMENAKANPEYSRHIDKSLKEIDGKTVQVEKTKQATQPPKAKGKNETFEVKYQWSDSESKLLVTVNGSSPDKVNTKALEKIASSDNFLRNYTIKQIQSGKLDQTKAAGIQPVPKTYDSDGFTVAAKSTKKQVKSQSR